MLARVSSFAIDGVESSHVCVEADVRMGLPAFTIVGLADRAVQEARERVRAAIVNSGFEFPMRRIIVNLAPAYLHKNGAGFDLAVAIAVLIASGQIDAHIVDRCAVVGELSLGGETCSVQGALAIAEGAVRCDLKKLILPSSRAREAVLIKGIQIVGVTNLGEAIEVLSGREAPRAVPLSDTEIEEDIDQPDLAEVRGHNALIPALEVAAAGGHNIYLHGPPGTGKTMLARRIPSILPPMDDFEAIEVTRIHSIVGLHDDEGIIKQRPFRAPHHSISSSGLVGGGVQPTPGEVTLAHHGVLFLDELTEFKRTTLDALRQPLEDGRVAIARSQRVLVFPTRFMFVAAANPCPCGHSEVECRCSAADLLRYQRRISGPLLDRIDIALRVLRPSARALKEQSGPCSQDVRNRVAAARSRQLGRFTGTGIKCNSQMTPKMEQELIQPTSSALKVLYRMHERCDLSARGHSRILRVARTIADLADKKRVEPADVMQAAGYRFQTPNYLQVA